MTDRLIMTSQELRAEGENLDTEIERHAKAMYDRIIMMQQRLHAEINQLETLRRRFAWTTPQVQAGQGQLGGPGVGVNQVPQQQRIRAVEANKVEKTSG